MDELPEIAGLGGTMSGLADVTVPAVMRKDGLHGPIRTDLSFTNPSGAMVMALLQLVGFDGGCSIVVPLEIPARQRIRVTDVVSWLRDRSMQFVPDEGMLRSRGFVPANAGDLAVETYYEGGASGRVGTSMPYFVEGEARRTGVLATGPADGDPRLTIYSALAGGMPVHEIAPLSFRLRVVSPDGTAETRTFEVDAKYLSSRLSQYVSVPDPGSYFAVESENPALRVLIVSSDRVSGSPSAIAGPSVQSTVP